jgi:hypothetical protein
MRRAEYEHGKCTASASGRTRSTAPAVDESITTANTRDQRAVCCIVALVCSAARQNQNIAHQHAEQRAVQGMNQ